tara:strand:+ start:214 stop:1041 length:828 start_codon:yes stop_codon:yes gene_type:complete
MMAMVEVAGLNIPPALAALPQVLSSVLGEIAEDAKNRILAKAQRDLNTAQADYVTGLSLLQFPVAGDAMLRGTHTFATITLVGWLANAVEHGWTGDMREALLSGRNAKTTLRPPVRRYNIIPFRHGTPGTSGRSFAPMGSQYSTDAKHGSYTPKAAKKLGKKIHRAARKLEGTTSHPKSGTKWGERLAAGIGGAGKLREHHRGDLHQGMHRMEKTYRASTQSTYGTFRTVSDKSDSRAWIHPGIEAHDFFGKTQKEVPAVATFMFGNALKAAGAG